MLGRLSLFKSIEFAGVVRASTIRRLMPFLSLILAWILLGEVISGLAGVGMGLIAGSFVLPGWRTARRCKAVATRRRCRSGSRWGHCRRCFMR